MSICECLSATCERRLRRILQSPATSSPSPGLGIASIPGNSHFSKNFSRKAAKTQRRKLVEFLTPSSLRLCGFAREVFAENSAALRLPLAIFTNFLCRLYDVFMRPSVNSPHERRKNRTRSDRVGTGRRYRMFCCRSSLSCNRICAYHSLPVELPTTSIVAWSGSCPSHYRNTACHSWRPLHGSKGEEGQPW